MVICIIRKLNLVPERNKVHYRKFSLPIPTIEKGKKLVEISCDELGLVIFIFSANQSSSKTHEIGLLLWTVKF